MRRTIGIAAALCLMLGGEAFAGRGHGRGHGSSRANGGVIVHEAGPRGHYGHGGGRARVVVSGGRYVFPGGVVRSYRRPSFHRHFYNRRVRPEIVVESYDPVPGYVWVAGNWQWGGSEWVWNPGYWAVADEPAPPPPVVNGGIRISGGISIH